MAKAKQSAASTNQAAAYAPERMYLIGIAIALVALTYIFADSLREPMVNQGDQAVNFRITANDGKEYSIKDFHGKVLVLNFWASWCKPCVDEMPSLNRFAQDLRKDGVVVLGISVDHDKEKFEKFVKNANIQFPVYLDEKADIPWSYGTTKYPETYIIDKSGKVVEKIIGERVWVDPQVIDSVKRYL
jgi:peroxiredoxin